MRNSMRSLRRDARVALDHALWTSIAQRTASTTLRNSTISAIARAFDDATMMHGNGWVDHVAAQRTEPRKRAVLVRASQPAEPDDISRQDRCYLALAMF